MPRCNGTETNTTVVVVIWFASFAPKRAGALQTFQGRQKFPLPGDCAALIHPTTQKIGHSRKVSEDAPISPKITNFAGC